MTPIKALAMDYTINVIKDSLLFTSECAYINKTILHA